MKKYLFISIILSLISFALVFVVLQNYLLVKTLQKDVLNYVSQTIDGETRDRELPQKIISNLEKIHKRIHKIDIPSLKIWQVSSDDALTVTKKFLQQDQNYVVLLQNSDEIRATGGFMGSFFILETKDGQIINPEIQDIYVPDGQFQGFIEAPKGLAEYTSSGKGMRLPDSNWSPHFPDAAQQILFFMENIPTNKSDYQGVIAINLGFLEDLLRLTGEIYLPDYKTSVNHENFAALARADREGFFPGSTEKTNFLNHFQTVLKTKLQETIQEKPRETLSLIQSSIQEKNIQVYSRDEELMNLSRKYDASGEMKIADSDLYYFLVESNVGINKANRLVERAVEINIEEDREEIKIIWQNQNPFAYVNYQRIYLNPQTQIISVALDGKPLDTFDQKIVHVGGENYLELGFLAPTLSQSQSEAVITLDSGISMADKKKLTLQKQSGIQDTPYQIKKGEKTVDAQLRSDLSLDLD